MPGFQIEVGQLFPQHELGSEARHGNVADFRDQRHRARRSRIGFQDVHGFVGDGVLHVHEPDHIELHGNFAGVFVDGVEMPGRDADGGNDAG